MRIHELLEASDPDYDLKARYQHYNRLVWDGKLPDIPIVWATLKGVGGEANAKMKRDPNRPAPNPMMVRLGRVDKYADMDIVPGSLNIRISNLYKRSDQATDMILLHEMIHIHFYSTGHLGEAHGMLFREEMRRVSKSVGFQVPITDSVSGFDLAADVVVKPYGVILLEPRGGGYRYAMMAAKFVEAEIDAIRERETYFVKYNYNKRASVYIVADEVWSKQAFRTKIQRRYGPNLGYFPLKDQAVIDDLRQNGRLLADITPETIAAPTAS